LQGNGHLQIIARSFVGAKMFSSPLSRQCAPVVKEVEKWLEKLFVNVSTALFFPSEICIGENENLSFSSYVSS
jgi:hypothetical protein